MATISRSETGPGASDLFRDPRGNGCAARRSGLGLGRRFTEAGDVVGEGANVTDPGDDPVDVLLVNYRAELVAAKARVVAAADDARRRIERDLHDGLQQWLVSLGLRARQVEASLRHDQQELKSELARIADGLMDALESVREISRGLYPTVCPSSGSGPR